MLFPPTYGYVLCAKMSRPCEDLVFEHGIAKDSAVGVKNRVITGLYGVAETPLAKETIDTRELPMFPGVVDSHVHSYGMTGVSEEGGSNDPQRQNYL